MIKAEKELRDALRFPGVDYVRFSRMIRNLRRAIYADAVETIHLHIRENEGALVEARILVRIA